MEKKISNKQEQFLILSKILLDNKLDLKTTVDIHNNKNNIK